MAEPMVVSFSGGQSSAFLCDFLLQNYADAFDFHFVFANTGREHEETLIFADKVDKLFGLNLVWLEGVTSPVHGVGIQHRVVNFETASRNGGPITPDLAALKAWRGKHAFISFAHPEQLGLASEVCQSFALDNGAFTAWKAAGRNKIDWADYYDFVARWRNHPGFDFAIIPDVIDGGEAENEALLDEWPHGDFYGVPVWHMNESDERFIRLCNEYAFILRTA